MLSVHLPASYLQTDGKARSCPQCEAWSEKRTVPIQTRTPNGGWNEALSLPTRIHLGQMTLVRSRVRVSLLNELLSPVIPATR